MWVNTGCFTTFILECQWWLMTVVLFQVNVPLLLVNSSDDPLVHPSLLTIPRTLAGIFLIHYEANCWLSSTWTQVKMMCYFSFHWGRNLCNTYFINIAVAKFLMYCVVVWKALAHECLYVPSKHELTQSTCFQFLPFRHTYTLLSDDNVLSEISQLWLPTQTVLVNFLEPCDPLWCGIIYRCVCVCGGDRKSVV